MRTKFECMSSLERLKMGIDFFCCIVDLIRNNNLLKETLIEEELKYLTIF